MPPTPATSRCATYILKQPMSPGADDLARMTDVHRLTTILNDLDVSVASNFRDRLHFGGLTEKMYRDDRPRIFGNIAIKQPNIKIVGQGINVYEYGNQIVVHDN